MTVISFINQKGGVGKTTIAINVADCLSRSGYKVLLVDADKQGSSTAWASLRKSASFSIISMARENLAKEVINLSRDFDFTIIDAPPHAESISRSCIIASDLVVMPIEPSGLSTWASDVTIAQVRQAQELKPTLKCGFVVSRKLGNTVIGREIKNLIAESNIHIFNSDIENRVAVAECITMGKTIFEWERSGKAARQFKHLAKEIMSYAKEELPASAIA